jgi:hypothetical protein
MQSPTKDSRLPEIRLPEFDRPTFELPDVDLSRLDLPKVDLSRIDVSKVDVGKALTGAAAAVGLVKPRRSRWPFVLGAGVVVAAAGLVALNQALVRERLGRAKAWIDEQVTAMRAAAAERDPVAFTAAETRPIEPASETTVFDDRHATDYPEGLGASSEPSTANDRSEVTTAR